VAHLLHSCPTVGTLSFTKTDVNAFFSVKEGGAPRKNALGKARLKYSIRFFNWFHAIHKKYLAKYGINMAPRAYLIIFVLLQSFLRCTWFVPDSVVFMHTSVTLAY
jgi:hypothetical protein